jgi:hypothetical protein
VSELPELPGGDEPPSVDALADRLASLVGKEDHEAARTLLADRILPSALSGLSEHPRPRRLAEVVYEDLGERLTNAEPDDRMAEVERLADEAEIRSLAARAQALAVARYLSDDPNAVDRAGPFLDAEAEAWRERGAEAIAEEASSTLDALEEWAEHTREEHPELFETRRTDYLHAKLALGSARTGTFGTAAGPLYDFLDLMGTARDRLDIH